MSKIRHNSTKCIQRLNPQTTVGTIAALASLLTATLVLPSLVVSDMMSAKDVREAWLPFWVGDMPGVMALAPLFIGLLGLLLPGRLFDPADLPVGAYGRPSGRFALVFGMMIALLVASMLLAMVTRQPNSAFAIFFLVIPHMWIACTESPLTNALAVGFTSFLIAFLVQMFQLMDFVMVYQFAIRVIAANTLFGLAVPTLPFVCTVRLARAQLNVRPTRLPDVCNHLGIELRHHQADSDAEACARIVMAAQAGGWRYEP